MSSSHSKQSQPAEVDPDIDVLLLHHLMRSRQHRPLEQFARWTSNTSAELQPKMKQLQAAGCRFDYHPTDGVLMDDAPISVWQDYLSGHAGIQQNIPGGFSSDEQPKPRDVHVYQSIGSTQDDCRRVIEAQGAAADGLLVTAHHQTAGRGRLGRQWHAPAGKCATFSIVQVVASAADAAIDRLMLASAVGANLVLNEMLDDEARIKWPNDVLVDGKKLAGILIETHTLPTGETAAIIGVGVNVSLSKSDMTDAPEEVRNSFTSLAMYGRPADRLLVIAAVAQSIEWAFKQADDAWLADAWRQFSTDLGQRIHLREGNKDFVGDVIDIDPNQGIVMRTDVGSIVHLPAATTTVVTRG